MLEEKVMTELEDCFEEAVRERHNYIGVLIQMEGHPEPELIINEYGNFDSKLAYYKKAYNEDLTLRDDDGTKIIDFAYGDTVEEIADIFQL